MLTRRAFLEAAPAAALAASPPGGRAAYRLGCQTLPYRGYPLARALDGIAAAGYRYLMIYHQHGSETVFAPSQSPAARAELRRQLQDRNLEPFMRFVGLTADIRTPVGLKTYLQELDLCAEFGVLIVVGTGPWYYTRFPTVPKRARDWQIECDQFYAALERALRHAESLDITITLKPHTGITATAAACLQVMKRLVSPRLRICWDAGNVSFYEGIYPDPDLPDLAPQVAAVCIKDHRGGRAEANFPVPGEGQIDHEGMFRTLFQGGFHGPIAVERVDGTENAAAMPAELIDRRIQAARRFLEPILEKTSAG